MRDRHEPDVPAHDPADRRDEDGAAGHRDGALTARRLLPLAWAAGAVDATSYLLLGGVFTANMTGNTVLLGITVAEGDGAHAARSAAALGGFAIGALLGALVPGTSAGLAAEVLLLVLLALLGELTGVPRVPLILIGGATMGAQTSAVRDSNDTGVNVTYITGTVTTLVRRMAREHRHVALPATVWLSYALGGLIGALLAHGLLHRWTFLAAAAAVTIAVRRNG